MKKSDHRIVQQVLDGEVSRQGFDGFQQRLREEPELVTLYGEYALLHHTLGEEYEDQEPPVVSADTVSRGFPRKWVAVALAAAAVVVLAAVLYRHPPAAFGGKPIIAVMKFSDDAVWRIEGVPAPAGGAKPELRQGGTLRLLQGRAEISPAAGIHALVEGPASLTFVSEQSLHLAEGRGRFREENPESGLVVTTPSISAVDLGTEFAVEAAKDRPDELHVLNGEVQMRLNGKREGQLLRTGQAGRVSPMGEIEVFPADQGRFPQGLGGFEPLVSGPFVKGAWRRMHGNPSVSGDLMDGQNYSMFSRLPHPAPDAARPVLLATLEGRTPSGGVFHTDGWAGMSFYSEGVELLFFGDSFGPESTWSLDVKQRIPIILPANPLIGAKTVTLRYDRRTGDVSLHEGRAPLGPAFCSGKLPVALSFDEIRLGASSSAALAVGPPFIRSGGM